MLVSAALVTACDSGRAPEDVPEVVGYAIEPLEIAPDELWALEGMAFEVEIVRDLPVVHRCFLSGDEDARPRCDELMGEGWALFTEEELETLALVLDCDDGGILNGCWGLTVWERGTGPGLVDLGGMRWRPLVCGRRSWVAYTLTEQHGAAAQYFPDLRIFTDTTAVFIHQCSAGVQP